MQFAGEGERSMKGLVMKSLGDLEEVTELVSNLAIPQPDNGEIRVKISAASVNPIDWRRAYPQYGSGCTFPAVPGVDGAGVVDAVGEGVHLHSVGDRVHFHTKFPAAHGSLAEFAICLETSAVSVPDDVGFDVACALPCAAWTAYEALYDRLRIGTAKKGTTIYIPGGAGGVGQFAVQMALGEALTVITSGGSDSSISHLKSLGCQLVLNYNSDDIVAEIMKFTNDEGVSLAFETVSNENCATTVKALGFAASIVSIVNAIADESIFMKGVTAHHVLLGAHAFQKSQQQRELFQEFGEATLTLLQKGTLTVDITSRSPLDGAKQQLVESMKGHTRGKRVLICDV